MNRSDAPKKQAVPFATNGQRENLLPTTPAGDNTASYDLGFPPATMILKAAGGLPPKGQDMNQILFELSALGRWASAGSLNTFDSDFSTSIGGYPKGSILISDDSSKIYFSTMDANTNNPNSVSTGWLNLLAFLGGAPIASPTFTGTPAAPTATAGTNSTQIATTAFVQAIITALSLGTASQRNVGTSTNQIPDMNSFTSGTNWLKLPSGHILQFFQATAGQNGASFTNNFPIAFPTGAVGWGTIPITTDKTVIITSTGGNNSQIFLTSTYASSTVTCPCFVVGK